MVARARQPAEPRAPARALLGDDRGHARGAVTSAGRVTLAKVASTALTRRCTSGSSQRPSLSNKELMCFSTARSVSKSDVAIEALFLPWAMFSSTSLSRWVRCSRGVCGIRLRRDQRLDHPGVEHRAARGDLVDRLDELVDVGDPFLEQVSEPGGPAVRAGTRTSARCTATAPRPRRPGGRAGCARCVDALVVFDGGMRMSVSTASGSCSSTAVMSSSNELAVPISSTSSDVWSSAAVPSRTR